MKIPFDVYIPNMAHDATEKTITIEVEVVIDPESGEQVLTPESMDLIEQTQAEYMHFEVHPEPETLGQPHENCVICKKPTRYWMADKHTPLCPTCAKAICGPKSKKKAVKYSPKDAKIDYNKHTVKLWDAAKDQSIVLTFEAIECLYKATK